MASKNSELWQQARRARDTLVDRFIDHPAVSLIDIGYDPSPGRGRTPIASSFASTCGARAPN